MQGIRIVLIVALLLTPAVAQDFRATLTGRVIDPTDAHIRGAAVTVTNLGTNAVNIARTDSQGNYTVLFLQPGIYSVLVEAPGFRRALRDTLELSVNQTATQNFKLELGAVTQEVTVTAETPILEAGTGDRGGVIDGQLIREFPLNGRNPYMLAMLVQAPYALDKTGAGLRKLEVIESNRSIVCNPGLLLASILCRPTLKYEFYRVSTQRRFRHPSPALAGEGHRGTLVSLLC